ncbi:flagellar hook-associated protein FlgK [Thermanaerovibrio velox DSM 12556]|uniref:Flagellar hook-associated protein 1 n=1 Tax=Thermanaerovibrio velox DSM 12556 TaxID=926567 RepID=H0USG7_9BACT|nr:flagellar hook-associated protein FlgK [Thermanaerovibrio velox]EHM10256.1 flagellar hook-associated protein FlgK [Thermanaerovibrio velox DSM 12556]
MLNSFFGFEMGRRAMDYFRRGMEVAGHNMSNAHVEGYSRQRVEASASDPFTDPGLARPAVPGQIGTGVQTDAIRRLRDLFLDAQYREEVCVKGYWDTVLKAISQTETYVNEPGGKGFQASMNDFWAALQEVSKRPDNSATRENLVQNAKNVVVFLQQLKTNYDQYRTALNKEVRLKVEEANSLIDQIAQLNGVIEEIKGVGGNPNDLLDRRDLLVEKLSRMIDCTVGSPCLDEADGDYKIDLGGKLLVQGTKTRHLVLVPVAGNQGFFDVQVEDNQFQHVSDPTVAVAIIEQRMPESVVSLEVQRLANEKRWELGRGNAMLSVTDKDAAIGLRGSFALQVSSSGVVKSTASFPASGGNPVGTVLIPPSSGSASYRFRVAAGSFESLVSVVWNSGTSQWDISDNLGNSASTAGGLLNLSDLNSFFSANYGSAFISSVSSGGDQLTLSSVDRHLIAISDVQGDLARHMGLTGSSPAVTIEVTEGDSLTTIANKINAAYSSDLAAKIPPELTTNPPGTAPSKPEQWLRCLVEQDGTTGNYYLKLQSDLVGEAYRINVLGGSDCGTGQGGSLYMARKLGFVNADDSTSVAAYSEDAYFKFEGREYLSSTNSFKDARSLSASDLWSASSATEVYKGLRLELKGVGLTQIQCRHHVKGGEIRGLLESRDDFLLAQTDWFDEIVYGLVTEFNALHYSGHGAGDYINTTGIEFFTPVTGKYGASGSFSLNPLLEARSSLIAAYSGDGKGKAQGAAGNSSGDGTVALKLAQLKQSKVLNGRSSDFNSYYESFIAELGAAGQRATTMAKNQKALVDQIETQRQSVMGVNLDEEMMDIIKFQQAFNGMARYITTIDEMLDKIINGMGRVGL